MIDFIEFSFLWTNDYIHWQYNNCKHYFFCMHSKIMTRDFRFMKCKNLFRLKILNNPIQQFFKIRQISKKRSLFRDTFVKFDAFTFIHYEIPKKEVLCKYLIFYLQCHYIKLKKKII
ncbi:hypothetical protein RFI_39920 [Reticulomyxa filosa]|uniref:Uncharacterized protein n=1 Tax=Reticulomyxa filosa TaxID=46433 RepID=X6LA37_RETFI|nr:hypothetical protein RFI_39920 [Reticulomyxa filosa]|eukprot:ETN97609.1 hypothetical protein RFI_39920 [Reticulomyxa filosa]